MYEYTVVGYSLACLSSCLGVESADFGLSLRGIQDGKPVFLSMYCGLTKVGLGRERVNPLSPKIHIQILNTDLHTFLLRIVERIWFKIKASSLW